MRKHRMKPETARQIAEAFLASQDMKGWTATFAGTSERTGWPCEISVIFDLFSPDGGRMGGPMVVIVDKQSGTARFFPSP